MKTYPDVWLFDEKRRVYRRDQNGRSIGGPIWREHWSQIAIVGETRLSWVSAFGRKIPKKGGQGICFSQAELDEREFVHENAHRLAEKVARCKDYTILKIIADLV